MSAALVEREPASCISALSESQEPVGVEIPKFPAQRISPEDSPVAPPFKRSVTAYVKSLLAMEEGQELSQWIGSQANTIIYLGFAGMRQFTDYRLEKLRSDRRNSSFSAQEWRDTAFGPFGNVAAVQDSAHHLLRLMVQVGFITKDLENDSFNVTNPSVFRPKKKFTVTYTWGHDTASETSIYNALKCAPHLLAGRE